MWGPKQEKLRKPRVLHLYCWIFGMHCQKKGVVYATQWRHAAVQRGKVGRQCCLMSSDVTWHIRNKLRPMPKHGSIQLYVHGNQKARQEGQPRTATSTLTERKAGLEPFIALKHTQATLYLIHSEMGSLCSFSRRGVVYRSLIKELLRLCTFHYYTYLFLVLG